MVILTSAAGNLDGDLMKELGWLPKVDDKDVIYLHTNDGGGGEKSV